LDHFAKVVIKRMLEFRMQTGVISTHPALLFTSPCPSIHLTLPSYSPHPALSWEERVNNQPILPFSCQEKGLGDEVDSQEKGLGDEVIFYLFPALIFISLADD